MRSFKLAALATTVGLVLAGCASGNPQVAAYVNGEQIKQSQVDPIARALEAASPDSTEPAGPSVLQILIQIRVIDDAVAANPGLAVPTESQRDQVIAANANLAALAKLPDTTDFVNEYIKAGMIARSDAGNVAYTNQVAKTTVRVNPRFGAWDQRTFSLVKGSSGSISSLAPPKQG